MPPEPPLADDEHAPVLGTWRRWYVVVLGTLVVLTALFALLTQRYR